MPQARIAMTVRKATGDATIIEIEGEMTSFCENVLMDAYTEAATGDIRAIVLNFGGLEYMNSGGIGLLVTLLIRVNRQGQRLLAFGLSEHYRHIFGITRLDGAIGIFDDEAAALAAVTES